MSRESNEMSYPGNVRRSEESKLAILRDYFENQLSQEKVVSKYRLSSKQQLWMWIGQYMGKSLSLWETEPELDMRNKKEAFSVISDAEKDRRIKSLEKALDMEKLRSTAFETMIDVAEKDLHIAIRKKAGTKQ
jgi:transposase